MARGVRNNVSVVAVVLLLCCCAAGCLFRGRGPRAIITSNDPASRIPAIKEAAEARETETAPYLVKSLESDDPAVRFYAIRGLQDLTGESFGYMWYADERFRRPAVEKWKKWLGDSQDGHLASGQHDRK